jgi:hypothetical protein
MNAITSDVVDNYTFLNAVFSQIDTDVGEEIAVCAFTEPPEDRETWPAYAVFDSAVNRLVNPDGAPRTANSYFCISTVAPADRLRRTQDAWRGLYLLPLDDVGTGPGAKVHPDLVPLAPSYKLETSPGNWQYGYLFDEPLRDLPMARALLALATKDHGDTGASIASKYIRLPQGYNNKRKYGGDPFMCRLTDWNPDRRFTVLQLLDAFGVSYAELLEQAEKLKRAKAGKGTPTKDEMYEWLVSQDLVISDPDAEGFASVVCPWHALHTDQGDLSGRYSPLGCGGDYKNARQFKCFHGHCSDKNIEHFTNDYFTQRFVFIRDQALVFDRQYRQTHKIEQFKHVTANYATFNKKVRVPCAMTWLTSLGRVDVSSPGFAPGQPLLYNDSTEARRLNTYREFPLSLSQDYALITPILQHIKYLFGEDADHFLGFAGWTVHHPEDRIQYALLHIAPQHGTGRGFLKKMFEKLFTNASYIRSTTLTEMMESQFNDFMWQSLLVFFDEVHERTGRYKVQDRIREIITEPRLAVNIKNGFKGTTDVYANIVMFSNHMNPLIIPPEDRRIWPVVCPLPPKSVAYYKQLHELLKDPAVIRALSSFLRARCEKGFDPHARAPVNSWTQVVFGGDADPLLTDIGSVLTQLRSRGAKAIWRNELVQILRDRDVELPPVGDGGVAWQHFNRCLNDLNVLRGARQRARRGLPGNGDNRSVMLAIGADPRAMFNDPEAFKAECERISSDPKFKHMEHEDGDDEPPV